MRTRLIPILFALCAATAVQAAAQTSPPPQAQPEVPQATPPPPPPPPPPATTAPTPPQTPPPRGVGPQRPAPPAPTFSPDRPGARATLKNIKLDITIGDTASAGPSKKALTLLIMNGRNGQIRSSGTIRGIINVDAHPTEMPDGRVMLSITLEYLPESTSQEAGGPLGMLNESLSVLLDNGTPTLITQSADPRTDRRVTVEVTVTVMK